MIATGGVITGLAALKRQDSARSQHHLSRSASPPPEEKKPVRHRPRADVVIVRGKIRLYSPSGFFLILGVLISVAGIAMAVLGYWPQKEDFLAPEVRLSNNTQIMREGGIMARFFEQHLHSEKMKMLGPFTMGIGIFIFICANAILHENRDKETKVIHMRDIYSTVIDIHTLRIKEQKHLNGAYAGLFGETEVRHNDNHCASNLAANTIASFSGFGNSFKRCRSMEDDDSGLSQSRNFTSLLPPLLSEHSGSVFGLHSYPSKAMDDRNSSSKKCETKSIVSSSINAFTLPVIKLNNCVIDEPDIDSITEDSEINKSQPRNLSMDSLTVPSTDVNESYKPGSAVLLRSCSIMEPLSNESKYCMTPDSSTGKLLSPGAARKQFGSNASLHILSSHSKSLDLERGPSTLTVHVEQRKHPSWPRLDRSNSKGYMKLENKEDPMDRLIVPQTSVKKDYTNKEKLLMISRSHNNLSFEHDEFLSNNLKRGTSETRF
ncbi:transmembrane protein 200A isoform X2 [Rhinatrema bivittatum]|nr:transmembrane protein 200A isoform X2 [Rhinatrema bivittatum]XP_029450415.1 transmembrane protein 200A isoform X2 [Rhinatrema bivittatum]XP_029450416.1 transmembrane protein 200A isoform X2 [Rhinatrema bivittatum]XP_029450417.1 transmembrane protein 200A isoform X2 [Rhinatrema bivittatum]XP_029450418.1 transmembrane protein 200A isoform X2 [Rhinatrema bivittatum]XP_029450419.1 transmembrane protein 200A isoform X2 [Rhinatrema bivittatum]XP_029450420.1 transmembrane protein 200A isoform X2 